MFTLRETCQVVYKTVNRDIKIENSLIRKISKINTGSITDEMKMMAGQISKGQIDSIPDEGEGAWEFGLHVEGRGG